MQATPPTAAAALPAAPQKQSILIAYPYFSKDAVATLASQPKGSYRLIVDSGAFTAWNTGKVITLGEYCTFLDSIAHLRPYHAVQLDVFGNPAGTYTNFIEMRRRGYNVMPVFTRGDTKERLDEFYSDTDYIMFGGITTGGKNQNYMKWFLRNNVGRKAHWLGFCRLDFIKAYRPHSVDSSSWTSGGRFGVTSLYAGQGAMVRLQRKDAARMPPPAVFAAARTMGLHRHEVLMLQKDAAWVGMPNAQACELLAQGTLPQKSLGYTLSAISYVLLSLQCERSLGTRYYMAIPNDAHLKLVLAARAFLRVRKVYP